MVETTLSFRMDVSELAVRILEASFDMKRPEGKSAIESLKILSDESRDIALNSAEAAISYFIEQIQKNQQVEVSGEKT